MTVIVKAHQGIDLYTGWVSDDPVFAGSRADALRYLTSRFRCGLPAHSYLTREPGAVLALADDRGSSDCSIGYGVWSDDGNYVALPGHGQRWLRRSRMTAYALLYLLGDMEAAYALTEGDGEPVPGTSDS